LARGDVIYKKGMQRLGAREVERIIKPASIHISAWDKAEYLPLAIRI